MVLHYDSDYSITFSSDHGMTDDKFQEEFIKVFF